MRELIRQGDVLLMEVDLPANAVLVKEPGDLILKEGEVTGHAHRIVDAPSKVGVWSAGAERFIRALTGGVQVTHEDHPPVNLTEGKTYQLLHQHEEAEGRVFPMNEAYRATS